MERKNRIYLFTAIISFAFAFLGFSYNTWRLEVTEDNNNIRMASFSVLNELAEFEQIVFAAHYDQNTVEGSPRKGWVKVGLIADLAVFISPQVEQQARALKQVWGENWPNVATQVDSVERVLTNVEQVRQAVKSQLRQLD
ncbi:hypothetical protein [Thalassotalea agarivorans]|uniref:Uncharacterized protein n=1 Tax=Thalassotalea agarivorans TaxID=349064 RepID=A0A1H9YGD5_THASX|nr:hypothetical protein [Thalassotalea agarivorans]SES67527.1 hypothetical protein SAMN05660429_00199 [Thalassotalea agarivorans]